MSLIRRAATRVAKVISATTTEITSKTDTPSSDTSALVMGTSDKLYLAFRKPFACRYFKFSTLNTNTVTLTVKYWDGSAFTAVEDVVDQTSGFTANGFLSWENEEDWTSKAAAPWVDEDLYWIEITVSSALSAGTAIQAVLNLFCDDSLLSAYYPELVTNTSYLPSGQSDFLPQYVAAKDMVVTRLKQDHLIDDESWIIDPNEVALSATHFAAFIILNPIVTNPEERDRANQARKDGHSELNKVRLDIDTNDDGIIEETEEESGDVFIARGGAN